VLEAEEPVNFQRNRRGREKKREREHDDQSLLSGNGAPSAFGRNNSLAYSFPKKR
jgi:hypothetical protein